MDPLLLSLYNRELQYIRELGAEFARDFPKIAGRLGVEDLECADPYVERLLEGFAFLAARVHLKLEAEFPRFTQHLLETVYPHYLAPVPSMAIVQFHPELNEGSLADGYTIPRDSVLRGALGRGEQTACEYRTAHATTLWPIELVEAEYVARDVSHVSLPPKLRSARAGLRLKFRCTAGLSFESLALDSLPIFMGRGQREVRLYEQVFANLLGVVARSSERGASPLVLGSASVRRVGMTDEEAMLPVTARSFQGYRLLQEYFAFHPRFLFAELTGLQPAVRATKGKELEIVLLFNRRDAQLENVIDASDFHLFCTPAINLFPRAADRIHLDRTDYEYHVVPDRTRPLDLEVFQVNEIVGYGKQATDQSRFRPLYALSDQASEGGEAAYFSVRRQPRVVSDRQRLQGPRSSYIGSEVFVSLTDALHAPYSSELRELDVQTLCTNRDLPLLMPLGLGATDFTLDLGAPVDSVRCVVGPSEPRPPLAQGATAPSWRLINHLSLNYLSLTDTDDRQGAVALRELLRLYADPLAPELGKQIEGVRSVHSKGIVRRLPGAGPITFGRGTEITLSLDETSFEGYSVFLLGAVLAEFFTRYSTINSFTETVLRTVDRGEIMRWPVQIGRKPTL